LLPDCDVYFRLCFMLVICAFAAASSIARFVRCIISVKPIHSSYPCNNAPNIQPMHPRN
jgi:hypothetical protein